MNKAHVKKKEGVVRQIRSFGINGTPKPFVPVKHEAVSAKDYLKIIRSSGISNIKHVRFVPPQLGSGTFGSFVLEYRDMKLVSERG